MEDQIDTVETPQPKNPELIALPTTVWIKPDGSVIGLNWLFLGRKIEFSKHLNKPAGWCRYVYFCGLSVLQDHPLTLGQRIMVWIERRHPIMKCKRVGCKRCLEAGNWKRVFCRYMRHKSSWAMDFPSTKIGHCTRCTKPLLFQA